MKTLLRILVALPAALFVVTGLRWIVDPAASAAALGMPLLEAVGRSTQVGDMAAFFLSLGAFMLVALITRKRSWFYAPAVLLGLTAVCRILAWLIHDAALAIPFIALEAVVACLLLVAARSLALKD